MCLYGVGGLTTGTGDECMTCYCSDRDEISGSVHSVGTLTDVLLANEISSRKLYAYVNPADADHEHEHGAESRQAPLRPLFNSEILCRQGVELKRTCLCHALILALKAGHM